MPDDDFFTPEDVDEQIDSLSHAADSLSADAQPAQRIVSHLHHYYQGNAQKQHNPLDNAWKRIVAEHQAKQQTVQGKGRLIYMQDHQNGQPATPVSHKKRTFWQRLSVLAAVLFIGLLLGGMALALNLNHHGGAPAPKTGVASGGGTPLPTPAHPITGGACTIDTRVTHPRQSTTSLPGLYIYAKNQQSDNLLYRYDPQTKKVIWSIKMCQNFYISGGETFEQNGIVYLAGSDWTNTATSGSVSYLYALNETDGSVIWGQQFPTAMKTFGPIATPSKNSTPDPNAGSSPADLGMIEAPTLVNGVIYVVQRSGTVYAFNALTGAQIWKFNSGRSAWATSKAGGGSLLDPSSIQVVNGIAYFSIVDRVFALNAQNGTVLWDQSFNNALNINQDPAIDNGTVYVTAFVPGYGAVTNPDTYLYAFDAQHGTQKWVSQKLPGYINGPLAAGGQLYAMSYAGVWYTFNASTGAVETQKVLPEADGVFSPILFNGVLYHVSNQSVLAELRLDGSARWSVQLSGHPVIDDVQNGVIYLSTQGAGISAYNASNGAFLWHYAGSHPQPNGFLNVTIVP